MGLILKLFGIIDLAAAISLFVVSAAWFPNRWALFLGIYLAFKGVIFMKGNVVSKFDILIGGYLILAALITFPQLLNILFGLYLGLKALYSFV